MSFVTAGASFEPFQLQGHPAMMTVLLEQAERPAAVLHAQAGAGAHLLGRAHAVMLQHRRRREQIQREFFGFFLLLGRCGRRFRPQMAEQDMPQLMRERMCGGLHVECVRQEDMHGVVEPKADRRTRFGQLRQAERFDERSASAVIMHFVPFMHRDLLDIDR